MRILYFFQGARGLGRTNRFRKIINALIKHDKDVEITLVCGSTKPFKYEIHDNIEIVKLPEIFKGNNQDYISKKIKVEIDRITKVRAKMMLALVKDIEYDYFLVDSVPSGIKGELLDTLRWLHLSSNCKSIFFMRDILDTASAIIESWDKYSAYNIIEKHYAKVFIFGNKKIFDSVSMYRFPETISAKSHFLGYLKPIDTIHQKVGKIDILVTVGGGSDGKEIVNNFLQVYERQSWTFKTKIVLGIEFPLDTKLELERKLSNSLLFTKIEIITFTNKMKDLCLASKVIVCMGGYNTLSELIYWKCKPIVIPRVLKTQEQYIRAKIFAKHKLIWHCDSILSETFCALVDYLMKEEKKISPSNEILSFSAADELIKQIYGK